MTALANAGDCFTCGEEGHWVQHCPLNEPPATRKEHERRISLFVERWINGKIATSQKRQLIETENRMWNSAKTGAKAK